MDSSEHLGSTVAEDIRIEIEVKTGVNWGGKFQPCIGLAVAAWYSHWDMLSWLALKTL